MKLARTGLGPSRATHHSPLTTHRRSAFTLIEMLIVIAIIVILVAMLLPVVFGALRRANETKNRSDISQLATSVQLFQTEFKVKGYFPSRIHLAENYNSYNLSNQLDKDSVQFLTGMFPRIDLMLWSTRGIDWNGDVPYGGNYNGDFILE